ncbi:DUF1801 domain-containing protein [Flavobacteriaceae bacterium 3-367]|uniref:DUF1801 domain-containing protein n=1 Tax=Eudoraea algarum TaxID=3417568 RepID=UPI003296243F
MAQNKTIPNQGSVTAFLDSVEEDTKREDAYALLQLMKKITGQPPVMWGNSIVGFGSYHYKYNSGREGDMLLTGFSPRKQNFALYIMTGFKRYPELMEKLGKHKTGKSCLYIKRLKDVDTDILTQLISASYEHYHTKYNG